MEDQLFWKQSSCFILSSIWLFKHPCLSPLFPHFSHLLCTTPSPAVIFLFMLFSCKSTKPIRSLRIFNLIGTKLLFFSSNKDVRNAFMLSTSPWFLLPYSPNPHINTTLWDETAQARTWKSLSECNILIQTEQVMQTPGNTLQFCQCSSFLTGKNNKIFHWLGSLLHKHGGFVMTCKSWEIRWNIQSITLTVNILFKVLPKFVRFSLLHLNAAIFNTCSFIQWFSPEMTVCRNPLWASQSISLKIQLAPWNSFEKVMVTSVSGSALQPFSPQQFSNISDITNQVRQQFQVPSISDFQTKQSERLSSTGNF